MQRFGTRSLGIALVALLAACGPAPASAPPASPSPGAPPLAASPSPAAPTPGTPSAAGTTTSPALVAFPGAATVGLTASEDGILYAVFGRGQSLYVARSDDAGASFAEPVLASGASQALINPFEGPTVAAGPDGVVAVSWLEQQAERTTVWIARSDDGAASFKAPEQVAVSGEFETTMARLALPPPTPAVAWLQGGGLWLGQAAEGSYALAEVDNQVCECCQPAALHDGKRLVLAYRNLERTGGVETRDVAVVVSEDAGASFRAPVRASDTPWAINACPISGPALAAHEQRLFVAWMDGRADTAHDGSRGDLWVAVSDDGGASFGPNVRVNPQAAGFHTLPALGATPDGRLHIAWEAHEDAGVRLLYSVSDDAGTSFGPPQPLAVEGEAGRPRGAAIAVGSTGIVHIAWVDQVGAHVLSFGATPT